MAVRPGAAPRGTSVRRVGTDALSDAESATSGFVWRAKVLDIPVEELFTMQLKTRNIVLD